MSEYKKRLEAAGYTTAKRCGNCHYCKPTPNGPQCSRYAGHVNLMRVCDSHKWKKQA